MGYNLILFNLFLGLTWCSDALGQSAYGAYGLFPQGSTRVLAMGGAFAGLSDDASGMIFNPAGLAHARWGYDISGGTNRIVNKEVVLTPNDQKDGLPYTFEFYSLAVKWKKLALGIGTSSPYNLNFVAKDSFASQSFILNINRIDAVIAYRLSKKLGVGITVHREDVELGLLSTFETNLSETQTSVYPRLGLSFRPGKKIGLGVSYVPQRSYDFNENIDDSRGLDWFHDVAIPAKLTVGGFYRVNSRLIWVLDFDFFDKIENGIYVGSTLFGSEIKLASRTHRVTHGGFEYKVIEQKDLEFIWRGGGYLEPSRLDPNFNTDTEQRTHFTMGVEVRLWAITFSAAYDQMMGASDFTNTAQSVSISIDAL